jgi:hypothetical protein
MASSDSAPRWVRIDGDAVRVSVDQDGANHSERRRDFAMQVGYALIGACSVLTVSGS